MLKLKVVCGAIGRDVIDIRLRVLLETQLSSDNCSPVTVNNNLHYGQGSSSH